MCSFLLILLTPRFKFLVFHFHFGATDSTLEFVLMYDFSLQMLDFRYLSFSLLPTNS